MFYIWIALQILKEFIQIINLSLIAIILFFNFNILLNSLGVVKQNEKKLVISYTIGAGIILVVFLFSFMCNILFFISTSLLYRLFVLIILLFWSFTFLLNLATKLQKSFLDSIYPEFITIVLIAQLHRKRFFYKMFILNYKYYIILLIFVSFFTFFYEYPFFGQIYIWYICTNSCVCFILFKENLLYLIYDFNKKNSSNNNDKLIINLSLFKIFDKMKSGLIVDSIFEIYNYSPSLQQYEIPTIVFTKRIMKTPLIILIPCYLLVIISTIAVLTINILF